MTGKFAYSFDRETFTGAYESRQQALQAAMVALKDRSDLPNEGVFVGQWSEPNVQADNHAEAVVDAMRARWRAAGSEGPFLEKTTDQQQADLDYEIERVIRAWLAKHELMPTPTRLRGVSQHPIPNIEHVAQQDLHETSVIGEA